MADIQNNEGVVALIEQDFKLEQICKKFDKKLDGPISITQLDVEIGCIRSDSNDFTPFIQILSPWKKMITKASVNYEGEVASYRQSLHRRTIENGRFEFSDMHAAPDNRTVKFNICIRKQNFEFDFDFNLENETSSEVQEIAVPPKEEKVLKTMQDLFPDYSAAEMHGLLAREDWEPPVCVVECDQEARPGYKTNAAHEYEDDPQTLLLKVQELARLLRESNSTLCYSGAGLSTSAGIDDYATKSGKKSRINVGRAHKGRNNKTALPSIGHRIFCTLAKNGFIHNWIQQNHDGLPQKAGFPQHRINEIHGAWFDPSNPVVPMSGTLRDDLYEWLEKMSNEADLTIAVGTSLSGMNADQVFDDVVDRYVDEGVGLGGVIIGLQKTRHDAKSSLRIYSRIDVVMSLLMREMNLMLPPLVVPFQPKVKQEFIVEEDVFRVPYDSEGCLTTNPEEMILWDLRPEQQIKVTDGHGKGYLGHISSKQQSHYNCVLPRMRQGNNSKQPRVYVMGSWWVETCTQGLWPKLPVVNVEPRLQSELN